MVLWKQGRGSAELDDHQGQLTSYRRLVLDLRPPRSRWDAGSGVGAPTKQALMNAPPLRVALGAAMTDTKSTRRARRYTRWWTLWGTCSPCSSLRPTNRRELGWASWRRLCNRRLQASR